MYFYIPYNYILLYRGLTKILINIIPVRYSFSIATKTILGYGFKKLLDKFNVSVSYLLSDCYRVPKRKSPKINQPTGFEASGMFRTGLGQSVF